jgi:hypothetical protein
MLLLNSSFAYDTGLIKEITDSVDDVIIVSISGTDENLSYTDEKPNLDSEALRHECLSF